MGMQEKKNVGGGERNSASCRRFLPAVPIVYSNTPYLLKYQNYFIFY